MGVSKVETVELGIVYFIIEVVIFLILLIIGDLLYKKIKNSPNRRINNIKTYFPEEEKETLIQMFFLVMMGLLFIDILYKLIFYTADNFYLSIFDIALSLFIAITLDKTSYKNKILIFLLIPFGSQTFIIFGKSLIGLIDLIHIPILIYFIYYYYKGFIKHAQKNGLGITVLLLFLIVFLSFFITQYFESVNPLDSLVIVTNQFTSNGYSISGHTISSKLNSLFLAWGGYLISSVSTAILTTTILTNHFNKKINKINDKLDKIEEQTKEK